MRILLNTLFIFSFTCVLGQDYLIEDMYEEDYRTGYAPFLTFRNALHSKDYLMGIEAGTMNPAGNLAIFASHSI